MKLVALVCLCMVAVAFAQDKAATPLLGGGAGNPCAPPAAAGCQPGLPDINEAVAPIDEWIKGMKKQIGVGSNLYTAAKATVKPLIQKLKRTQKRAMERLAASNRAILEHVQEAATNHVYKLLKASQTKADTADRLAKREDKLAEIKAKVKQDKAQAKLEKKKVSKAAKDAKKEAKKKF